MHVGHAPHECTQEKLQHTEREWSSTAAQLEQAEGRIVSLSLQCTSYAQQLEMQRAADVQSQAALAALKQQAQELERCWREKAASQAQAHQEELASMQNVRALQPRWVMMGCHYNGCMRTLLGGVAPKTCVLPDRCFWNRCLLRDP